MTVPVDALREQIAHALTHAQTLEQLEAVRVEFLGKKGKLTASLKALSSLTGQERAEAGKTLNQIKQQLQQALQQRVSGLKDQAAQQALANGVIDVTLPGRQPASGGLHPVTQVRQRLSDIFVSMGFEIVEGPEIEDDEHNFGALNLPPHHPARAMQDTFYLESQDEHGNPLLLRTHTSSVQVRTMRSREVPLRIITPGRVYRCDSDRTHTPMFHQIEGLLIDKDCTFAQLKAMLRDFLEAFFGQYLEFRFRPSFFPYTEPSAEVDIRCVNCGGKGCKVCSHTGWLEVLGCGMVHPNVLTAGGIDPKEYSGFAFGLGIDRFAMLYYGIEDLRWLFENDLAFLSQVSS